MLERSLAAQAVPLLDLDCSDVASLFQIAIERLEELGKLDPVQRARVSDALVRQPHRSLEDLEHGAGVLRLRHAGEGKTVVALLRLTHEITASDGAMVGYVWLIVAPQTAGTAPNAHLESLAWMLADEHAAPRLHLAQNGADLLAAYAGWLDELEQPPPQFQDRIPPELTRSGTLFGGLRADLARLRARYRSDVVDGFHSKSIASTVLLFFACVAPAIAFGGLASVLTHGEVGAVETLLATAVGGLVYAALAGQPLTILGSTGPMVIFLGLLYEGCHDNGIPFLPTVACVGLWTSFFLIILVATEASSLIRWFTRFTDEIFGMLMSLIFVVEALRDTFRYFTQPDTPYDTALLSLILALGTFLIASRLSRFRRTPYLRRPVREFFADFAPALAILAMTSVAAYLHPVHLETLVVPDQFGTTSGRPWFVSPLDAPRWVWLFAAIPAALFSALVFVDQNVTVRLVNAPEHHLRKGVGYHLDLLVVALLIGAFSLFGLPWLLAATVRSLSHVRSLAEVSVHAGAERVVGVRETRVTGVLVHLGIGASLLVLPTLRAVPMSVLFGLFLFMGVASMRGSQLFERLRLWVIDPELYAPSHYLRRVPIRVVHAYTAIQGVCLALLWAVKASPMGLLFPFFVALLVPLRFVLPKLFDPRHLAFLDAAEASSEQEEREGG